VKNGDIGKNVFLKFVVFLYPQGGIDKSPHLISKYAPGSSIFPEGSLPYVTFSFATELIATRRNSSEKKLPQNKHDKRIKVHYY